MLCSSWMEEEDHLMVKVDRFLVSRSRSSRRPNQFGDGLNGADLWVLRHFREPEQTGRKGDRYSKSGYLLPSCERFWFTASPVGPLFSGFDDQCNQSTLEAPKRFRPKSRPHFHPKVRLLLETDDRQSRPGRPIVRLRRNSKKATSTI